MRTEEQQQNLTRLRSAVFKARETLKNTRVNNSSWRMRYDQLEALELELAAAAARSEEQK